MTTKDEPIDWGERLNRLLDFLQEIYARARRLFSFQWMPGGAWTGYLAGGVLTLGLVIPFLLSLWWGIQPGRFNVVENARQLAAERGHPDTGELTPGYVSVAALDQLTSFLLDKPGGYLHNDILPPGMLMDNMPSFERGVVIQIRDFAEALRDDMTRSQTQSREDPDLAMADPQFSFDFNKWGVLFITSTEHEYRKGQEALRAYLDRLAEAENGAEAQFYVRADNLRDWLKTVEMRLGDYAQQLAAARTEIRVQRNLEREPAGTKAKHEPSNEVIATPWMEVDNVWWEARGASYGLLHLLKGIRHDFRPVLKDKNALPSMNHVIRELRMALHEKDAWMVLNGEPFGLLANHSMTMSSYMARANAAVIDLRNLLEQG
ncbi:DUF2333 family protein [Thiohalorhabdus methylotrophus]|uniref:DUF2333 family protein n=1 Tax=Thiohalorhabdus methylotrophus TaxID=3242694 RepID=A0ABV4TWW4_9GAMM